MSGRDATGEIGAAPPAGEAGERDVLLMRLEAPLQSFGGVVVDERGVTEPCPMRSMLAGLLGNALGYDHREFAILARLQERLRHAARRDRPGQPLVDFQTVDLGQSFLAESWTTRGEPAGRRGGSAGKAIHIRRRHYWADAIFTVALALEPAAEEPDLARCAAALAEPARPLFLGRKPCIPSRPLLLGLARADSLHAALSKASLSPRAVPPTGGPWEAWWPEPGEPAPPPDKGRLVPICDERDWANQIHAGRRFIWEGRIEAQTMEIADD
jgi:CRISPR system Cascade subunit CasD